MGILWQDLRYGVRMLSKNPGFTAVAALTLALGVGANTAAFSMLKGLLLRPLPGVRGAEQLVTVASVTRGGQTIPLSYPDYRDFTRHNTVFEELMASSAAPMGATINAQAERVWGEIITGNYFKVLGARASLGRVLLPDDDRVPGGHPVAVISHALWQRRFGSDPGVIGKSLLIGRRPFTVVGVTEPGFHGSVVGLQLDIFIASMMQADALPIGNLLEQRGSHWLVVQGRLRPGIDIARAQVAMSVLGDQVAGANPALGDDVQRRAVLLPLLRSPFGSQTYLLPILSVVMVVCGIVLLVACGNLANVMLARAAARQREVAVRLSLGASRLRLIRQFLTESLLLSLLGGVGAFLVGMWTSDWFANLRPPTPFPLVMEAEPDALVLVFTILAVLLSAVLFGLAPALQASRVTMAPALKESPSTLQIQRSRFRSMLVVWQMALSLLLLICAGLVIRTQQNAARISPGFDPRNLAVVTLDLQASGYTAQTGRAFHTRLLERVRSLPGVDSASLAQFLPLLVIGAPSRSVEIEGYVPRPNEDLSPRYNAVAPQFFHAMRIPLVAGREFTSQDDDGAPEVAIVNETMARHFWPGDDALGRKFQTAGRWRTVVGVARDIKYLRLTESPEPYVYLPLAQAYSSEVTLHVRTAADPAALLPTLQSEIRSLDRSLPVFNARTMAEHMQFSMAGYALAVLLLSRAGLLALLLASVGIYGVISFTVTQRTHEIGVRMALGAHPWDILRLVVGQGLRLTLLGVVFGLLLALAATRALARLLYGVGPQDPLTFVAVTICLLGSALLACYLPARRASRVNPIQALRYE